MKLLLTSAYSTHTGLDALLRCAQLDRIRNHQVCSDPDEADAILFVENTQFDDILFKDLLQHPLVEQYREKAFMYNEMDRPWDALPGLYCCLTRKHINEKRHRAFAYLTTPNPYISSIHNQQIERRWLFSFMGSMSHRCRRPLLHLKQPDSFIRDTSDFNVWQSDDAELQIRGQDYAEVLAASDFVLCPRGIGTSSIRLYETLEVGRVPVIISDHWVPPAETDWRFAIQVEEARVASIPGLLRALANEAFERGQEARQAWLNAYAPDTLFNTAADSIAQLITSTGGDRSPTPGSHLHKWLASGELFTRTAARRLRRRS